jgi:UDP-GlcNAc3NAcA epimerase
MAGGLSHAKMTAKILEQSEEAILLEKPDFILVYGDTNTTIAGSLAAIKLGIPIIHIESGLRSFRFNQPEEINRVLTDRISTFLFCPSDSAVLNLKNEGIISGKGRIVENVGDIMQESALFFKDKLKPSDFTKDLVEKPFYLLTLHRQENTDDISVLSDVLNAMKEINKRIIFPIHPRTQKKIKEFNLEVPNNITLLPPVSYGDILFLTGSAEFVMTDSGGLQKESYFLGKKYLILREETEWKELVNANVAVICGTKKENILKQFSYIEASKHPMPKNIYGAGNVSEKIVSILTKI